jgi:ribonuclease P protein component
MRRFASLRGRGDFARVRARGRRTITPNLTVFQADATPADVRPLVGISVSKAVGGAVLRNRVRRRLAACVDETLPQGARVRVLISARPSAASAPYAALRAEVQRCLA